MANKKKSSGTIVKTYKFKVNIAPEDIQEFWKPILKEYQDYYNRLSDWICDNMFKLTIGDLIDMLPEKSKTVKDGQESYNFYYSYALERKDNKLFTVFGKDYMSQNCDNLIYYALSNKNIDNYNGNRLNISSTYYRQGGYFKAVISNYKSRMSNLKLRIKRHALKEAPSSEELFEQCLYEMTSHKLNTSSDWGKYIEFLSSLAEPNVSNIARLKALSSFFNAHEQELNDSLLTKKIEALTNFGGCHRSERKYSMSLCSLIKTFSHEGNMINMCLSIKNQKHMLPLYGRRDVIQDGNLLVDIVNGKTGDILNFVIEDDKMYVCVTIDTPFSKPEAAKPLNTNSVGIDINTKHMLFMTNIEDKGQLNGYINIYSELMQDKGFISLISRNKEYKTIFTEIANKVTFCPIESEALFTRIYKKMKWDNKEVSLEADIENYISSFLITLMKRNTNNLDIYNYISYVKRLRTKVKSYFILKLKNDEQRSLYDLQHNPNDPNIPYISDYNESKIGQEILQKMLSVSNEIIGCRDNIICYIYKVLENNGFKHIFLEDIENSNFERGLSIPSCKSILKYHKAEGKTIAEAKENATVKHLFDYYEFQTKDDKIVDAKLSLRGFILNAKGLFLNTIIKSINFASIKDKFIQLSNNKKVYVSTVPSAYTSQMNSINHTLYVTKEGKIVNKHKVRLSQERHLNGLNADYNAARNIHYIGICETMRKIMCKKESYTYGKPLFEASTKGPRNVILELKKLNATEVHEA